MSGIFCLDSDNDEVMNGDASESGVVYGSVADVGGCHEIEEARCVHIIEIENIREITLSSIS